MPDPAHGFWWNWGINAAVAVANITVAVVALFGQAFRAKFFPPQLSIRLSDRNGVKTPVVISWNEGNETKQHQEDSRYYHLTVIIVVDGHRRTRCKYFYCGLRSRGRMMQRKSLGLVQYL